MLLLTWGSLLLLLLLLPCLKSGVVLLQVAGLVTRVSRPLSWWLMRPCRCHPAVVKRSGPCGCSSQACLACTVPCKVMTTH
jgi:hypothetical protein